MNIIRYIFSIYGYYDNKLIIATKSYHLNHF